MLKLRAAWRLATATVTFVLLSHAAQAQDDPNQEPLFEHAQLRYGVSGVAGPMLVGYTGYAGGVDARFGLQLNPLFGIYIQPILLFGSGATSTLNGSNGSRLGLYGASALADFTFDDFFYAAAGPEILGGDIGTPELPARGALSDTGVLGPSLAAAGRAGFAFGSKLPRRNAFTIGIDVHGLKVANVLVLLTLVAVGFEIF